MLNYAYSDQSEDFKETEKESLDSIEKGKIENPLDIASLLEACGTGRTILGLPDAQKKLEKADDEITRGGERGMSRPVTELQILISKLGELYDRKMNGKVVDKRKSIEIAHEAYKLAKVHGYKRHIRYIDSMTLGIGIYNDLKDIVE